MYLHFNPDSHVSTLKAKVKTQALCPFFVRTSLVVAEEHEILNSAEVYIRGEERIQEQW